MPTDRIPEILSTTENTNLYVCLVFTTPVPRDHYGYTMVHTEGATNMMKTDNVDGSCPHMPTRCVDANVHTDNVDGCCPHIARQSVYTEGNTLSTDATMKCGFQVHRQRMHCVGLGETLAFVRIAYTAPSSAHLYQWMGSTRADDIDYTYSPYKTRKPWPWGGWATANEHKHMACWSSPRNPVQHAHFETKRNLITDGVWNDHSPARGLQPQSSS